MRVPAQFVPELGGAFGFSESELAANAEGRMTGKQRLRLLANGFWYWLFLAFIAVMTAAVAIRTAMVLANGFGPVVVLLVGILLLFALAQQGLEAYLSTFRYQNTLPQYLRRSPRDYSTILFHIGSSCLVTLKGGSSESRA